AVTTPDLTGRLRIAHEGSDRASTASAGHLIGPVGRAERRRRGGVLVHKEQAVGSAALPIEAERTARFGQVRVHEEEAIPLGSQMLLDAGPAGNERRGGVG